MSDCLASAIETQALAEVGLVGPVTKSPRKAVDGCQNEKDSIHGGRNAIITGTVMIND